MGPLLNRRIAWRAISAALLLVSCLRTGTSMCDDGRICPAGTVCGPQHACVLPEQLESCRGLLDGDACEVPGSPSGVCSGGVCLAPGCGDGIRGGIEACDGTDLDGISDCADLGYYNSGPVACTEECGLDVSACAGICGDRTVDPEEQCDSDRTVTVADCQDFGFYDSGGVPCTGACTFDITDCRGRCGDGVVNGDELCDDTLPAGACIDFGYDLGPLECSAFCTPGFAACQDFGWSRAMPARSESFFTVWVAGPDETFVGGSGHLYHRQGAAWTATSVSDSANVHDLWGSSPADVYAVGNGGKIWHFDGATWSEQVVASKPLFGVWGAAADDVYAVGEAGTIVHFDGSGWTPVVTGIAGLNQVLNAVWGSGPADVIIVGSSGTIVRYDGVAWSTESSGVTTDLRGVEGTGPDDVLAVGAAGVVLRYDGTTWRPLASGTTSSLESVAALSSTEAYLAGAGGTILRWDGVGLWPLVTGTSQALSEIDAVASEIIAVGMGDAVLRAGAAAWSNSTEIIPSPIASVWVGGPGATYALTSASILHREGPAWVTVGLPANDYFIGLGGAPDGALFATDVSGTVVRFDGATWTMDFVPGVWSPGSANAWNAVWATGATDAFVVGDFADIQRFDGTGWTPTSWADATGADSLYGVWGSDPAEVFAVGMGASLDNLILHYDGTEWRRMEAPGTGGLYGVWGSGPAEVFAVGQGGTILHFDGVTWTAQESGTLMRLASVSGTSPTDVFAVGEASTILHYDGERWSPLRALGEDQLTAVSASDGLVLFGLQGYSVLRALVRQQAW